jgi:hypothetical protein
MADEDDPIVVDETDGEERGPLRVIGGTAISMQELRAKLRGESPVRMADPEMQAAADLRRAQEEEAQAELQRQFGPMFTPLSRNEAMTAAMNIVLRQEHTASPLTLEEAEAKIETGEQLRQALFFQRTGLDPRLPENQTAPRDEQRVIAEEGKKAQQTLKRRLRQGFDPFSLNIFPPARDRILGFGKQRMA